MIPTCDFETPLTAFYREYILVGLLPALFHDVTVESQ